MTFNALTGVLAGSRRRRCAAGGAARLSGDRAAQRAGDGAHA